MAAVPDVTSGVVSAVVTMAYCLSFSALLFQGNLQGGLSLAFAALLMGSALTGIIVALFTTLPPADAGPDTPAIAVMSVLVASTAGAISATGGSVDNAVAHAMIAITIATLATGVLLFAVGACRLGRTLRFIPYPVIGGFLAASGVLLMTGAMEVALGRDLAKSDILASFTTIDTLKTVVAITFAIALLLLKRLTASAIAVPALLLASAVVLSTILHFGFPKYSESWFLQTAINAKFWNPWAVAGSGSIDWTTILLASAEISAVCGVTAIALLLDVTSLEVARSKTADIDHEFRVNGIANMIAAAGGGIAGNLSLQASILIEEGGGKSRLSGVAAAVTLLLVLFMGWNLAAYVPTALLSGLLIYLGWLILYPAIFSAPAERSWTDLLLALTILGVILAFGYLTGVIVGLLGACLVFAFSYSRIGVVRRHLTRAEFSSHIERSPRDAERLAEQGARIHLFWLDGFVFFGSSNGLFERIREDVGTDHKADGHRTFVILDCRSVSGFDTSAVLSMIKLRNHCDDHGITLCFTQVPEKDAAILERARMFGADQEHRNFTSLRPALEWCEEAVLDEFDGDDDDDDSFIAWMQSACGDIADPDVLARYFQRNAIESGALVYDEGGPSDTIDLVLSGSVAISVAADPNSDNDTRTTGPAHHELRRMTTRTVIGEMGFFRGATRGARVTAIKPSVVYTLTKPSYDKMCVDHPDLSRAFLVFIIRELANRVEASNRELTALL